MFEFDHNLAVIIGIDAYGQGIPSLTTATNDAKELARLLQADHHYHQVWTFLDDSATRSNLEELLQKILPNNVQANDRLLFYFAGHGIALPGEEGPQGYLIPQDAKLGDTKTYLPMPQVEKALNQLSCRHCLVILDCCFAGAFRWSISRHIAAVPEIIHRERYDRFIADPAWQVITSSAYDQKALDALKLSEDSDRGQIGNHSPFATALIEALSGKADAYPPAHNGKPAGDGIITATKLYLYLRDRVELLTEKHNKRQTPGLWFLKKHDKGEYIFLTKNFDRDNLKNAPSLDDQEENNPYRGLKPYEKEHADLFFGRTSLIGELCNFVNEHRLTVVLGASGCGKSSLIKAGLIPHLEEPEKLSQKGDLTQKIQTHRHKQQAWQILPVIRPGESPFNALKTAFRDILPKDSEVSLNKALASWSQQHPDTKILLTIDQLEEVITLCRDESERKMFFTRLANLLQTSPNLCLILILRSEFTYLFWNISSEEYWKEAQLFIVPTMTRDELREVIKKPALAKVIFFNPPELVEQLIDEVVQMPGALALLSLALSELYLKLAGRYLEAQQRGEIVERTITQADYGESRGVKRSVTRRADLEYETLVKLHPNYRQTIRHVMLRMVAVGGELARRRVYLSELEYPQPENKRVETVIHSFANARLLVFDKNDQGFPYVEPAHDVLVSGWERLMIWKKEEEENLILQRRLTPAAQEWKRQQQEKFLWNANPRLDLLKQVLKSEDNWLNQVETDFVRRSVRKKRQNTVLRWGIASSVLLGLMILSFFIWIQWRNSELNRADSLARYSLSLFNEGKELDASLEAIRAGKILQKHNGTDPEVIGALHKVLHEGRERNHLQGHGSFVQSVSISPDSQTLASVSSDKTIKLWNLETGEEILTLTGHDEGVNSVSISPDSKLLASGSADSTIKLWDLETKREIRTLTGHNNWVNSVSFSPDSKLLASGSDDSTIKIWNLETGKAIHTFTGHEGAVNSVSFSPDSKLLASGSADSTIKIWNLETGEVICTLRHTGFFSFQRRFFVPPVNSVSFSPDGKSLASGSWDNTIKLWNPETGEEIRTLTGHDKPVISVSFSPDSKLLASGSGDETIKLWDLETGKVIRTLRGHRFSVSSVSVSPDGKVLASGSGDLTIKLWNLETEKAILTLQGPNAFLGYPIMTVSFSPNGRTLASGGHDKIIKLWNLETGKAILTLTGHDGSVHSVSFSPDSKLLASGSSDETIKLWNLETGKAIRTLTGHDDSVHSVSFSPDSKLLAAASSDKTIKLWNPETGEKIRTLTGHNHWVNGVSFSPDGKVLASGSYDKTVKLWNVETGEEIRTLTGHDDSVDSVSFSPDGKVLASGSRDNTIKLWKVKTGKEIHTLLGHDESVNSINFSPDGKTLASGSSDKTIKLWNLETGEEIRTLLQGYDVTSVSFSTDGQLASGSADSTIKLWNLDLDLDSLIGRSCDRVRAYLKNRNSGVSDSDRNLCDGIYSKNQNSKIKHLP